MLINGHSIPFPDWQNIVLHGFKRPYNEKVDAYNLLAVETSGQGRMQVHGDLLRKLK